MKPGIYYVGDLCYVMHDCWKEVCELIIEDHKCLEGTFHLKDGRQFVIFNTRYGDGTYHSNIPGQSFTVDAGSIGCILVSDINDPQSDTGGGEIVTFVEDFDCFTDGSTLTFGHIQIYTGDYYEEEYEYYEDE